MDNDFNYVKIPNTTAACVVKQDEQGFAVTLANLDKSSTWKFRASTKPALRQRILTRLPNAVFSMVEIKKHSLSKALLNAAEAARQIAKKQRQAEFSAEEQHQREIIEEARRIALTLPENEQNRLTELALRGLETDPESKWRQYLYDRPNFLRGQNKEILLRRCREMGFWPVPCLTELCTAFKDCVNKKVFRN